MRRLAILLTAACALSLQARAQMFAQRFGSTASAWSPLSVANCGLWLDASDITTVTKVGTAVTAWADKSTEENDAAQNGADSTRPTYGVTNQNGLATIYFDGGDYLLSGFVNDESNTVFAVVMLGVSPATGYILGARDTSNTRSYWGYNSSGIHAYCGAGDSYSALMPYSWSAAFGVFSGYHGGGTLKIYSDGVYQSQLSYTSGTADNDTRPYLIGGYNNAGAAAGLLKVYVGEVICYRRVLTDGERATVTEFLQTKWGL